MIKSCRTYTHRKRYVWHFFMTQSRKNTLSDTVGLPKDVVLGLPLLTITGNEEICVENYRRMIEYTEALIRIQTKVGQIRITGNRLKVEYYSNDEMRIHGSIANIEYMM